MADNPQKVEVEAELDASQTVRGARDAAKALTEVIAQASKLEAMTRQIFSGQGNLPKQLEAFTKSLQQVKDLPAQLAQVQRAAQKIASGGPAATLQNATVQGVISNIRTDPALQLQRIERETNKVLQARQEIYRRIRAAMPDETSAMRVSAAYRSALNAVGDMPEKGSKAYTQWIAKTRGEVLSFERDWSSAAADEAQKRASARVRATQAGLSQELKLREQHQREAARLFKRDMGAIMQAGTPEERRAAAQSSAERVRDYTGRTGRTPADLTQLMAVYDQAEETHFLRSEMRQKGFQERITRADAEALNKRFDQDQKFWSRHERAEAEVMNRRYDKHDPKLRQQRVQDAVRNREDFQNYNGGANNFASRLAFTRDFAAQAALLGSFAYAATSTVELQTKLKNLQAITQATDTELASLQKTVLSVGQTTKFSTSEIAEGATVMAQAGYSASQIAKALPAIANLATGAGASMEDAVNIVTSVLSVYDMSIERSANVSNMLAEALNGSKLSLDQLSLGIQYVGNISADAGVSFEEMTAALGAMANAGIKSGSTLGTGLRALIQELENPSQKFVEQLTAVGLTAADVDVRTQGLAGALNNLTSKGFDSGAAMNTFEVRAASAFSALSNNVGTMVQIEQSLQNTSAATQAAAINMETLSAQAQRLGNALTGAVTTVGAPYLLMLQSMIGGLADLLTSMTAITPVAQLFVTAMLSLMTVGVIAWASRLTAGLVGMNGAFAALNIGAITSAFATRGFGAAAVVAATGVRGFTAALAANPITWWTVALTLAVEGLFAFNQMQGRTTAAMEQYRTAANTAKAETESYEARMSEITQTIEMLTARHASLSTNTQLAGQAAETAQKKFGEWGLQLDANGRNVDNLIFKLVQLRAQMAATALAQAKLESESLAKEKSEIQRADAGAQGAGGVAAIGLLNTQRSALDKAGLTGLVEKYAKGQKLSVEESLRLQQGLRSNSKTIKGGRAEIVAESLASPNQQRLQQIEARQGIVNSVVGQNTVASSGSAVRAGQSIAQFSTNYNDELARISKLPAAQRPEALLALRQQRITEFPSLQAMLREEAKFQLKDPTVRSGFETTAKQQGITPEQAVYNQLTKDTGYAQLSMGAGQGVASSDPKVLRSEQAMLTAQIAAAKRTKDKATEEELRKQKAEVDRRLIQIQNPDMDPLSVQQMMENSDATNTAQGVAGVGRSGGANRTARNAATTAAREAKALEREIELAGMDGPSGAVNPALKGLLDQWKAARIRNIKFEAEGSGASNEDLQQRLDDFTQVEAPEYFAKVLEGNLEEAKKIIAEADERRASTTTAARVGSITGGSSGLMDGIMDVQQAWQEAMASAIEASDQSFKTKGVLDPSKVREATEARRKIMIDFVSKMTDAINELFAAEVERQTRAAYAVQAGIEVQRTQLDKLSNFYGNRRVSDVQRQLGAMKTQKLDEAEAGNNLNLAQGKYNSGLDRVASIKAMRDLQTDPQVRASLAKDLNEATDALQPLRENLDAARNSLEAMVGLAPQFTTLGEAMNGAWAVFSENANTGISTFEIVADGLLNTFEVARTGMGSMWKDVLTGTKSMKAAFKDFTYSVLDSLFDMATKILANKILTAILNFAASSFTKGAAPVGGDPTLSGAAGTSIFGAALGGEIPRRMALGGNPAPFRDNVLVNAMPGEIMMRKSAVDMIGRDNLLQLNAQGNNRISRMPSISQAMPQREPDEVNVWIVPEGTKPSMGKKDVIAVVSEDLATGGIIKKLVANIAVGG